jgi:hypothetical protein
VFGRGEQTTRTLAGFMYRADSIDVLDPGTQTTLQDWPGRVGYWDIGVPPSGPMDSLAFRLGNRLLGNPEGAAGLELTVTGPTLRFNTDTVIALTGARMSAHLDGQAVALWTAVPVRRGQLLELGGIHGAGVRSYLLVRGGLAAPAVMGSRATFTLGRIGGHGGRVLRPGDVLHLAGGPGPGPTVAETEDGWRSGDAPDAVTPLPARMPAASALPPEAFPSTATSGACACCTARTARRTSSRPRTSGPSSAPTGRCTTTPAAPACA